MPEKVAQGREGEGMCVRECGRKRETKKVKFLKMGKYERECLCPRDMVDKSVLRPRHHYYRGPLAFRRLEGEEKEGTNSKPSPPPLT